MLDEVSQCGLGYGTEVQNATSADAFDLPQEFLQSIGEPTRYSLTCLLGRACGSVQWSRRSAMIAIVCRVNSRSRPAAGSYRPKLADEAHAFTRASSGVAGA